MRDLSKAYALIRLFEGCVLHAYQDVVGVWTIGYGTTDGVRPGMVIDKETAELMMEKDVQHRLSVIGDWITAPQVTDNEISAILSLVYNIGLKAFHHSQLLYHLNSGDPKAEVAQHFMSWIHAGGRIIPGLVNRRKAEMAVFLS